MIYPKGLLEAAIICLTGILIFFIVLGIVTGRLMCWALSTPWSFKTAFFDAVLAVVIVYFAPDILTNVIFKTYWMPLIAIVGVVLKHLLYFVIYTKKYLYLVKLLSDFKKF
jgi:hypothetical protein